MASKLILTLVAVILGCGSATLAVVWRYNPALRGLGWLGLAFASGSAGTVLLLSGPHIAARFTIGVADLLVLLAFVLLHVAVLDVVASASLLPFLGLGFLLLQVGVFLSSLEAAADGRIQVAVAGLLIATQTGGTAERLFRMSRRGERAPARFTASILICLAIVNLARSMASLSPSFSDSTMFLRVQEITFAAYVAAALGIAFGFFWTSTTVRANGLEHLASTDPLTRLFNRRVFLIWCEKEWERSRRTGTFFSILMIDLDHFKQINDHFGHHVGDGVLCASVEKIQDAVRGIDVIGRWGGEEFAALLPGANLQAALLVAERVRRNIERVLLPESGEWNANSLRTINLTACVGISTSQSSEETIQEMMRRADKALYRAKANGRNSISAADRDHHQD